MELRRALISVSDKTGVVEFAKALARHGVELVSTGGTAQALRAAGLKVREVSDVTGHPEILGGRVKTLHPKVHGGILARRAMASDLDDLRKHEIEPLDLVCVNLYPFEKAAAKEGISQDALLEEIDIGGVALLRAAAKSWKDVVVVASSERYASIVSALDGGGVSDELRQKLAVEAFERTSAYDRVIAATLAGGAGRPSGALPAALEMRGELKSELRYGENPHQKGAFYVDAARPRPGVGSARVLSEGKALSYNNILDLDAALGLARDLDGSGVVVVKHAGPCGVAEDDDLAQALEAAWEGDPLSAFGSVIGFNRRVTLGVAQALARKGFVEAAIAPSFDSSALEHLLTKPKWGKSVRLLEVQDGFSDDSASLEVRAVSGGFLVQERDRKAASPDGWKVVTERKPSAEEEVSLRFAWKVVKHVRSNAITLCKGRSLVGVGGGLPSRVDAVHVACRKAEERAKGAALASDAFFPFPDGVELAASHGVTAVIQPGGSVKDQDVIAVANRLGLAMVFTGTRHFRH
ncbi:MAG: bifunctional phosphoribosylaminoimidazolecarboxamide formyltransferase/IMP cyclohydrolase [Planctomycetota bacterium]